MSFVMYTATKFHNKFCWDSYLISEWTQGKKIIDKISSDEMKLRNK